uniref:BTB domain-containing protein n=1 Tax=Acrobeloides nanus TaxID=290746 RepID=A0A914ERA5_9BILA
MNSKEKKRDSRNLYLKEILNEHKDEAVRLRTSTSAGASPTLPKNAKCLGPRSFDDDALLDKDVSCSSKDSTWGNVTANFHPIDGNELQGGSSTEDQSPCANFGKLALPQPYPPFALVDVEESFEEIDNKDSSRKDSYIQKVFELPTSSKFSSRSLAEQKTACRNRMISASRWDPNGPVMGWQAEKTTLKERMSYMFCNETLADVVFFVGKDEQRIPAHKFVLSIGSAVFDAMFNGGFSGSADHASHTSCTGTSGYSCSRCVQEIKLPDIEPNAFLALLKFLYCDEVSVGPDNVMTILYTAKKYAVPALELVCVDFLKENLSAENAFMMLTQARLFDEPQLASLCMEIIDRDTTEALQAEGFLEIDKETLSAVLNRDTLRIAELPLFNAIVRWATEECRRKRLEPTPDNKRLVLNNAINLIRFPLMGLEEFAQHIQTRWGYSGTPDRIKFTVDAHIYILGFGLYGSMHGQHEYSVIIEIINFSTGHVLAHNETSFLSDGSSSIFRVTFKEPVEISPGVIYIASACLSGPDSHYGSKGLRRIVRQSTTTGPITFQFSYAAGNNNGTSVDDGQIPELIFCTKLS